MNYVGRLTKVNGQEVTFFLNERPDIEELSRFSDSNILQAEVTFDDNRRLSADQRKKAWALINDIARHTGFNPVEAGDWMKAYFMAETGNDYFSLSDCSVTIARLFISYLINFCFEWNIPFKGKGLELHDDIRKYLWLCIKHRKCALCGLKGEIHHMNAIGAGRDRKTIDHSNHDLICLCRKHHNEAHSIGRQTFEDKHKAQGIKLVAEDVKRFRIGG